MTLQHLQAAAGRWHQFSLVEQMANIGSEVFQAIQWKSKKNSEYANAAFNRSLELFDLTIQDPKNRFRLREVTSRLWADFFMATIFINPPTNSGRTTFISSTMPPGFWLRNPAYDTIGLIFFLTFLN